MKINEKQQAIELRKQGLSVIKIAKQLGVSKSTAFLWTRHIPLTDEHKKRFAENRNYKKGVEAWVKKCQDKRLANEIVGKAEVDRNNWEHAAGVMLWWAEGDKSKNVVAVTNCDASLLRFFVHFLKKFYGVRDEELRICIQYHGDMNENKLGDYWKTVLGIPGAKMSKGYKKEKRSCATKWPNGICRVRLHNTEIASRLWGSVQEYIGFNSPDFLSGKKKSA